MVYSVCGVVTVQASISKGVLLHALCHYALQVKILSDFNLTVSTLIAKLSNIISHQIFRLYSSTHETLRSRRVVVIIALSSLLFHLQV